MAAADIAVMGVYFAGLIAGSKRRALRRWLEGPASSPEPAAVAAVAAAAAQHGPWPVTAAAPAPGAGGWRAAAPGAAALWVGGGALLLGLAALLLRLADAAASREPLKGVPGVGTAVLTVAALALAAACDRAEPSLPAAVAGIRAVVAPVLANCFLLGFFAAVGGR